MAATKTAPTNLTLTVREAVGRYVPTLKAEAKLQQQQELNRFVRELETLVTTQLTAQIVEKFQEDFERTGADSRRLEPIKLFLAYVHKQGWSDANYGKFVRIRRVSSRGRIGSGEQVEMPTGEMLTAEGHQRLQDELDELINVKRPEIARELFEARIDKDFRENAPFDAAKHHQAEVEARIRQLQGVLARAQIIKNATVSGRIALGTKVTVHDLEDNADLTYTLVSPNEASPAKGRISVQSPLGRALLDRVPGESVDVEAPGGVIRYRVERVDD